MFFPLPTGKCKHMFMLAAAAFLIYIPCLFSQEAPRVFEKNDLYPEGRLEVGTYGFATKYLGEFTDNRIGEGIGLTTRYTLPFLPEISIGARYTHGYLRYDRRYMSRFGVSFDEQYPEDNFPGAKDKGTIRRTKIDSYEALAYLNLFPRHEMNYYLMGGIGALAFQPQDIIDNPYTSSGKRRDYEEITEKEQFDVHYIGGLGIDYYFTPVISLGAQAVVHILSTDYVDGYASTMSDELGQNTAPSNMDAYADFGLKLSYHLFTDNDSDNDGLLNSEENSLGMNPYSPDSDDDGVLDVEEVRTFKSNALVMDSDSDGLGDAEEAYNLHTDLLKNDTDDDGLSDFDEARLYKTNPVLKDSDGDDLADAAEFQKGANPMTGDTDGDGVRDLDDNCPTFFGLKDNFGCPNPPPSIADAGNVTVNYNGDGNEIVVHDTVYVFREVKNIRENESYTPYGINFEAGKSVIREESEIILDDVARWLKNSPSISVEVRGHTDADGSEEYNARLAETRANAVRDYLISQGIEEDRLEVKAFGEYQPVASNDATKGKARNRRIEFFVKTNGQKTIGEK
jgi:outer membrane protein OmpA-like peptidoglycan-associated protein